ncbi:MAG: 4Fe-4S dicluster domain-containing protein [Deltaproteobacteria bacterium]|nr:4Fe-4S dicluster domain-containing protein [Deltaproteobacteria bacterium]
MATVITEECINCGACEPECPNTAIYASGIAYELVGATLKALSDDFFYIVPDKCTECVGFVDHEACAAVCPVDCCIPDPKCPENEDVLLARARKLHPDRAFEEPPPSRFRKSRPTSAAAVTASLAPKAPVAPESPPAPPIKTPTPDIVAAPTPPTPATAAAVPVQAAAVATKPQPTAPVAAEAAPSSATAAVPGAAAAVAPKPAAVSAAPAAAAAAAPKVAPAPPATPARPAPVRAADPVGDFEVPVLCRNCQVDYPVRFGLLSPGANLRCPHCRASHSPTQEHFLLVGSRLRRYVADLDAARSRAAGGRGGAKVDAAGVQLRQALDRDLRAISARLLSRPKSSRLGLS